ncbi:MAG: RNA polymerase sigma factor [Ignavibacteria bacterium]
MSGPAEPAADRERVLAAFAAGRGRLVATLARMVGPAEAEDLADETLLKALAAIAGFRGDASLSTWLHRIALNLAYDHLRGERRAQPLHAADDAETVEELAAPAVGDPVERHQMSACVQEVLATLPGAQRQVLVQADVLGQTAPEIAAQAGIATGNAKIRLHRARRALRAALERRCDFHHEDGGILCCVPKSP